MSFPFPVATIPDLPNNATPPTTSLLEISNAGVSENTSISQMLNTAAVEFQTNKGAVSGYAGLDASQELLIDNFPTGTALQVLRRNAANTALEFADPGAASPLTTKGDLYTFDTDNQRLPVGTNGQVLVANSATATGLEWQTGAGQTPWQQNIDAAGFNLFNLSYMESNAVNPSQSGAIRLGDTEEITWRNNGNSADLGISINNDQFVFNVTFIQGNLLSTINAPNAAVTFDFLQIFSGIDLGSGGITSVDSIEMDPSGIILFNGVSTQGIQGVGAGLIFTLPTGDSYDFQINSVSEYTFNATNASFGNKQLKALSDPTDGSDAATKTYVDNLVNGLSWKQPALLATTGNITLSGNQTIDGTLTVDDDRVLVKDQSDDTENGVYAANTGAWARTADTDSGDELVNMSIYITKGSMNADTSWVQTTDPPITIGVTSIIYAQVGAGTGNPLTTKGDIFGYDTANARIPVGTDNQFLMADSAAGLGVSYSFVNNVNLTAGVFSNITGLGSQSQDLNLNNNDITNVGEVFFQNVTMSIEGSGASFLNYNVGTGEFHFFRINSAPEFSISATEFDFYVNTLTDLGSTEFQTVGSLVSSNRTYIVNHNNVLKFNVDTAESFLLSVNAVTEYTFNATEADFLANNIRNFGFIESNATNPAQSGAVRLGDTEAIAWRNSANDEDFFIDSNDTEMGFNGWTSVFFDVMTDLDLNAAIIVGVASITLNGGGSINMSSSQLVDVTSITFIDNNRTTFNPGATVAGLNFGSHAGDPSTTIPGDVWYNTSTNKFRANENSVLVDMIGGAGSQTPWTSDIDADGFDLTDLSNIQFRATTGAPAAGDQAIYNNADIAMTFNVPTADVFRWTVQGVLGMQLNNLTLNLQNTTSLSQVNGLTMQGILTMNTTGGGYVSMNAIATPGNSGLATRGSIFMDSGNLNHLTIRRNDGIDVDLEGGASPLTTKGDIFTFSTGDTRLPVGTNGQILSANSAEVTGLEWITNVAGDVDGPGSSVDNELVRFNGVTGKIIQGTTLPVIMDDAGQPTWPRAILFTNTTTQPAASSTWIESFFSDLQLNASTGNTIQMSINAGIEYVFTNLALNFNRNDADQLGAVIFNTAGALTGGLATDPYLEYISATHLQLNVPSGDEFNISVNDVEEYSFSSSIFEGNGNIMRNFSSLEIKSITGSGIVRIENTDSTPSPAQIVGTLQFRADRTASSPAEYATIQSVIVDPSAASADGELILSVIQANNLTEYITLNETASTSIHFKRPVQDFNMDLTTGAASIGQLEGLLFNDDTTQLTSNSYIQRSNAHLVINSPTGEDIELGINDLPELTIALNQLTINPGTDLLAGGDVVVSDRFQGQKGPDVAGATTITLGDGNYFDITGSGTINHMTITNWQIGSIVVLQFDTTGTINHNTGTNPANTVSFFLAGAANFSATADDTITFVYDGTVWRELARSIN